MKSFLQFRSVRIAAALAVASGFAGSIGLIASTSSVTQAGADPAAENAFVGVGADVSQDLYNAYSGAAPTPGVDTSTIHYYTPVASTQAHDNYTIQSFDADPQGGSTASPGGIITKTGGPYFDRPNSSGAGTQALEDSVTGTLWENSPGDVAGNTSVVGQIDFARTAKGVTTAGGTLLTWIPFARDALAIAYYDNGDGSLATLTTTNLVNLYSSATGKYTINGQTVTACLPISTSSPVTNLVNALGLSKTTIEAAATASGCNNSIQQNSGNAFLAGLPAGTTHAVIPLSAASWIGQANGVGYDRSNTARADGVDLAAIDALTKPYGGSAPNETPTTTYYQSSAYGYNISTVVPTSSISGNYSIPAIEDLFVGSGSVLCSTAAQTTAHTFGFDSLTSGEGTCGSTTLQGDN